MGHQGSGLGGPSFALSPPHPPVPPLLSVPSFLQPNTMDPAVSGPGKAGAGLTASHQLQHRSGQPAWHGEVSLSSEEEPGRVLSAAQGHRRLPRSVSSCWWQRLVKGLSRWGLAWRAQRGTGDGGEGPQHAWPQPCSLLAWGSSGGGRGIVVLVAIPFLQYLNEKSRAEPRRGPQGDGAYADLRHQAGTSASPRCPCPQYRQAPALPASRPKRHLIACTHACCTPACAWASTSCGHQPPQRAPRTPSVHTPLAGCRAPTYPQQPRIPVHGASSKISSGRWQVRAVLIWEVGQKQSSGRNREQPLVLKPELALPAPLASC